jgi:replicative DNA helicase
MSAEDITLAAVEAFCDLEAEQSVLGGVLMDPDSLPRIRHRLTPEDFSLAAYGSVWQAILDLDHREIPVDVVQIGQALRAANKLQAVTSQISLGDLEQIGSGGESLEHQAKLVADLARARRVAREASRRLARLRSTPMSPEDFVQELVAAIGQAAERRGEIGATRYIDAVMEYSQRTEDNATRGSEIAGVTTGIRCLDTATSGLRPGQLIVIAARPGMGKTALAMGMAEAIAKEGKPVAVFSLEMQSVDLAERSVCGAARVNSVNVRQNLISQGEMDRHTSAMQSVGKWPIWVIDDARVTVDDIRAHCHTLHARTPLSAIVVDYLQLIKPTPGRRSDNREREVSEMSNALKSLAKELSVPVVLLSQLNRKCEERADKRPMLSDLRDSGSIEQDADVVMFIYRDCLYNRKDDDEAHKRAAEIIIAKQRGGEAGPREVCFDRVHTRFYDPADEDHGSPDWGGQHDLPEAQA